jgi:hypothetical protein
MSENQKEIEEEVGLTAGEALAEMTEYDRGVTGIAIVCHTANMGVCSIMGDNSQPSWDDAPLWQRMSAINGVEAHLETTYGLDPEESHKSWLREKIADGWVWGVTKNEVLKTHPCITPYHMLPPDQQIKDHVFGAIVGAMRPFLPPHDLIVKP